jgi:hypothetical protein
MLAEGAKWGRIEVIWQPLKEQTLVQNNLLKPHNATLPDRKPKKAQSIR